MATTQHRPHGAFAGPVYGTLDGKTEDTGAPAVAATTQHRPHGAFAGQRYGTLSGKATGGAPTAPSSVTGTPTGGTTATIAWTDNSSDETAFDVEIAPVSTGTYVAASGATNPTAANVVSFAATGLTANTEYTARVRAKGSGGDSAYATSASWWTDNTGGGGGGLDSHATLAATGSSGTFSGIAYGQAYVEMAATGGSGTFSGSASSPAVISMAATGGSGDFSGTATGFVGTTGGGIKKRKQAGMKAAPLPFAAPQQLDMGEVSMILAALFEVGVFNE